MNLQDGFYEQMEVIANLEGDIKDGSQSFDGELKPRTK